MLSKVQKFNILVYLVLEHPDVQSHFLRWTEWQSQQRILHKFLCHLAVGALRPRLLSVHYTLTTATQIWLAGEAALGAFLLTNIWVGNKGWFRHRSNMFWIRHWIIFKQFALEPTAFSSINFFWTVNRLHINCYNCYWLWKVICWFFIQAHFILLTKLHIETDKKQSYQKISDRIHVFSSLFVLVFTFPSIFGMCIYVPMCPYNTIKRNGNILWMPWNFVCIFLIQTQHNCHNTYTIKNET